MTADHQESVAPIFLEPDLLHVHARANDSEKLLEAIAAGCDINRKINGRTPILEAAEFLRKKSFMTLLQAGSNLDVSDANGDSLLHVCAGNDWADACQLLIDHGQDVNALNVEKRTPLHYWASRENSAATCEALVRAGADFNAKDKDGITPAGEAAMLDNVKGAKILIAFGSRADIGSEALDSLTAKQAAAQVGLTHRMLELLKSSAWPSEKDTPQMLAQMAAANGHDETAAAIQSLVARQTIDACRQAAATAPPKP